MCNNYSNMKLEFLDSSSAMPGDSCRLWQKVWRDCLSIMGLADMDVLQGLDFLSVQNTISMNKL